MVKFLNSADLEIRTERPASALVAAAQRFLFDSLHHHRVGAEEVRTRSTHVSPTTVSRKRATKALRPSSAPTL
jgi:hypothetical protein